MATFPERLRFLREEKNLNQAQLAEKLGTVVYGYNDVLGVDSETDALCQSMTMVEMSGTDFVGLADVNVEIVACLADREMYGEDVQAVWNDIAGQ